MHLSRKILDKRDKTVLHTKQTGLTIGFGYAGSDEFGRQVVEILRKKVRVELKGA